jgi:hypothetical protein
MVYTVEGLTILNIVVSTQNIGACGGAVVEALRYKLEGRGINS